MELQGNGNISALMYLRSFKMKIFLCILSRCDTYWCKKEIVPVKNDEDACMRYVEGQWQGIKHS